VLLDYRRSPIVDDQRPRRKRYTPPIAHKVLTEITRPIRVHGKFALLKFALVEVRRSALMIIELD